MRRNIISDEATEQRAGVHPTRETDGLSAFRLASEWTSGGIGYVSLMTSAHASFPRIQPEAAEGSTMNELDLVVLTHPIAAHGLEPRNVGTLVHVYQNGQAYEVEFVTAEGATIAARCWSSTHPSASPRFFNKCQRSATCTASGAPIRAPSAYVPPRSRLMTSIPGCASSHWAKVAAERSGSRSMLVPRSI